MLMQTQSQSPSIAFVGLLGSGKTTLAATLANRLVTPDDRGTFLVPLDHRTMITVQQTWLQLQSREWPASTLQGTFSEMRWKLHVNQTRSCEMRIVDVAGQDLYEIFSDDRALAPDKLVETQKPVFEYCKSADIVLLLVNLGDFIGEGDRMIAMRNEAAMKAALDFLRKCSMHKRVCIVLTQAELYLADQKNTNGWTGMVAKSMPFFFNAHLRDGAIPVIPVSAVFDTEIITDPVAGPRRVPKPGFRSVGLDTLTAWLSDQVLSLQGPTDPDPQITDVRTDWYSALLSTYLMGEMTFRNDGGPGRLRVVATSICNGVPIESGVQEVIAQHGQIHKMVFRLKNTRYAEGKEFNIRYSFEQL